MGALTILIIRHAEKPGEQWPGPGLTEDGVPDKASLVVRGWQRAGAWTALFGAGLGGVDYPAPQAIYAATPGTSDGSDDGPSRRPYETVYGSAPRLGLTTNTSFAKGDEKKLVEKLLGLKGVVLVCWEHKAIISGIIPNIPVSKGKLPVKWHGDRYDAVLRFDRADADTAFVFRELYPCLLSGDSNKPVDS
jgi:hypothetical protein